ncbi:uncharacterized protein LOC124353967 [Homalodisca vitripennis]|uniref:uncharacterized protein LOC124353967 n=1 Tax=Homalodisca vitripennis TaxID=197043 RepID=UPI001EEB9ACD|nr:uncharacterized protein LOC124353967 [Homalodisca vitripennis]
MNTELILLSALSFFISFPDSLAARKPVFRFSTSDYRKILQTTGFVDKTLMIKNIIDKSGVALITAPPKFGKSTNLDMLKKFLEIEVDKDGHPKTRANLTLEPVMDTENYKLFVSNELKITENKTIMEEHFGKYPCDQCGFQVPQHSEDIRRGCRVFQIRHTQHFQTARIPLEQPALDESSAVFLRALVEWHNLQGDEQTTHYARFKTSVSVSV